MKSIRPLINADIDVVGVGETTLATFGRHDDVVGKQVHCPISEGISCRHEQEGAVQFSVGQLAILRWTVFLGCRNEKLNLLAVQLITLTVVSSDWWKKYGSKLNSWWLVADVSGPMEKTR
jgi:hypothetical protein